LDIKQATSLLIWRMASLAGF